MKVFINCPFDKKYNKLLKPIVFTFQYYDIENCLALDDTDCATNRLAKIIDLINCCDISFHDLSRNKAKKIGEPYRLNMAFELGISYGKNYNNNLQRKMLVVEGEKFSIKKALSDYDGMHVICHGNSSQSIVRIIKDWLEENRLVNRKEGFSAIWYYYNDFQGKLYEDLVARGYSKNDIDKLPISSFKEFVVSWMADKSNFVTVQS